MTTLMFYYTLGSLLLLDALLGILLGKKYLKWMIGLATKNPVVLSQVDEVSPTAMFLMASLEIFLGAYLLNPLLHRINFLF